VGCQEQQRKLEAAGAAAYVSKGCTQEGHPSFRTDKEPGLAAASVSAPQHRDRRDQSSWWDCSGLLSAPIDALSTIRVTP